MVEKNEKDATNIETKANKNANNLSAENISSWRNLLFSDGEGITINNGEISTNSSLLVAEYTVPANVSQFTISGLNLANDGGVYDFVLTWKQSGSSATYLYMTLNNSTATAYTSIIKYYGSSSGGPLYGGGLEENRSNFKIGHSSTFGNYVKGTIMRSANGDGGILTFCENGSYEDGGLYGFTIYGRNPGQNNVTSLSFSLDQTFTTETNLKIYKRASNAPTRS